MGMIRFIPVTEITDPLNLAIGLSGGSGTGKTYTALLMARGISEVKTGRKGAPIGYVDTENRRALHYKAKFPEMHHYDFSAVDDDGVMVGFGPERWIEVIDAAEAAAMPVLIFDSFSHAWEGVGGVLDLQAQVLDRLVEEAERRAGGRYTVDPNKFAQLAWAEVKPRYRRLIDRIVRAKCDIIICTRAKPVMQQGFGDNAKNARKTKTRMENVPWDPASDGDLMFEMTVMIILDPKAPGCPTYQIKVADQFKALFDARSVMGVETGRAMAEWAKTGGNGQAVKDLLDAARAAAAKGKVVLQDFYRPLGDDDKRIVSTIMESLVTAAKLAEATANPPDEIAFGEDQGDNTRHANTLTDDEIRAQAEAEAAFAAERAREMAAE